MAGMLVITVYTECFSLIAGIGAAAHLLLLGLSLAIGYLKRNELKETVKNGRSIFFSWEGFFYCCFIFFMAFFTSRGEFHTDTNIYHAQAIRLYEEGKVIVGIGNLQLHYAYNSAYLAFASFFSFKWLFGQSLHTTTGWMEVVLCLYAFHGLKNFKEHKSHLADMMRVGILFYTLVILVRSMSPATDFATMLYVLFILTAWCETAEGEGITAYGKFGKKENKEPSDEQVAAYALLSIAAVYVATLKFSAALLVIVAGYPAFWLIKRRRWKETAVYLAAGCVVMCPFLIRNYLISGWLLYPFDSIDIFPVDWKIPREHLLVDKKQIEVWGKCLFDVSKADWKVRQWLPVWWEHQQRYEKMFLGGVLLSIVLQGVMLFLKLAKRQKIRMEMTALHLAVAANLAVWFFMAPFIRYGLAFLLAEIMLALGEYLGNVWKGFGSIVTGALLFCIIVSVSPYWDNYITDAGVFVKHSIREPFYIVQKDYDETQTESLDMNGIRVFYPISGEINSYHTFPGGCYKWMMERTEPRGTRIEDGFRAK